MVYFGQDGCPYLHRADDARNFRSAASSRRRAGTLVAIALNLWGDRETKWLDGSTMTEKALARQLDVQFTPTLLFFDEKG